MHKEAFLPTPISAPAAMGPRLQLLEYEGALSELRTAWGDLHRCCAAPPFLRWEWMSLWWDIYRARGDRLHLLAVRDGGELVALAPLYLQALVPSGAERCLRFLGTGEAEREAVCSEYLDLLIRPGHEADCLAAIGDYLSENNHRWQGMRFDRVLRGAHLEALIARLRGRYAVLPEACGWRHRVTLPNSREAWLDSLRPSMRQRLRRRERALAAAGGFTAQAPQSADQAAAMLDELARLHARRWASRGCPGAFAAPRFNAFHRMLCRSLYAEGALQLRLYHLGERTVAGFYGLRDAGCCHYYQSGFDPLHGARHSPLLVAHSREIRAAIERGEQHYDLMRGERDCYKRDFGVELTPIHSYRLALRGAASVNYSLLRARNWLRGQRDTALPD